MRPVSYDLRFLCPKRELGDASIRLRRIFSLNVLSRFTSSESPRSEVLSHVSQVKEVIGSVAAVGRVRGSCCGEGRPPRFVLEHGGCDSFIAEFFSDNF